MKRAAHIQPIATGGRPPEAGYIHHSQILQRSLIGVPCSVFPHTLSPITTESGYPDLSENVWLMLERSFTNCLDLYTEYIGYEPHLESVQASASQNNAENNWYIYHSDHLGSSSFLTDADGNPTQHLQYLPFGENFIEQRATTDFYTPYTFSAKERDPETGYSYFGARYYDPNVSVWLSVDPLSDKYPSMSAYMYCASNPMMLRDPNGREIEPSSDYSNSCIVNFIDKIFKNRDIATKFFTQQSGSENGNYTTIQSTDPSQNRRNLSYSGFKRALRKEVKAYNQTHEKKVSFSRQEKKDAYRLYKKIDSDQVYKVLCVNSSTTFRNSDFYNLTLDNRTSTLKLASEFSDVATSLVAIEEYSSSMTMPYFWQLIKQNAEKLKSTYLAQITNSEGIKEYPNGSFLLNTTGMKRKEINKALYNQLILR
jgi:RHS repeat-associated protein